MTDPPADAFTELQRRAVVPPLPPWAGVGYRRRFLDELNAFADTEIAAVTAGLRQELTEARAALARVRARAEELAARCPDDDWPATGDMADAPVADAGPPTATEPTDA